MALDLDSMSVAVINRLRTLPGYSHKKLEHNFCCPVHAEKTASAHYHEEKMGWKCFGCDAGGNLVHLARALHIDIKPFGKDDPPTVYEYQDETGAAVIRKTRKWNDAEKTFYFEHKKAGKWVTGEGPESFLYRLPGVLNAIALGQPIYIVNGEKAADAMFEAGAVATCSPHGETFSEWVSKKYYRWLKGAGEIIIVEQLDAKGREYSDELAKALRPRVRKVSIVRPKTGKVKHDAFDHLRAGYKLSDFVVVNTWQRGLDIVTYNGKFQMVDIEYLWEPYFPKGKAVLLDADSGTGKSAWCIGFAAWGSRGLLPIDGDRCEPFKTLYFIGDADGSDEYETIYRANGGIPSSISYYVGVMKFDTAGLSKLEETIALGGFRFVVIDALMYYIEGVVKDSNNMLDAAAIGRQLGAIAERTGCTIVAIRHTRKGATGEKASELGLGSAAFKATFRGQLVMRKHPDQRGVIVVTDEKGGPLVIQGDPFAFRRTGQYGAIEYICNFTSPFTDSRPATGRPNQKRCGAATAIRSYMAQHRNPRAEDVIRHVVEAAGVGRRTVYNAAGDMGLQMVDGYWIEPDPFAEEVRLPYRD